MCTRPLCRGGTTPGPRARAYTCAPLAPLSLWLHTFQVRTGDSRRCTRRCLALPVRAHRQRFNGTILEFASCRLGVRFSSRAFRTTSGLATPGVRGYLLWRDLYVSDGVVSTVPCTSSVAAVCRRELLSAVVFSRVAGAWPLVARVCYSS